MAQSFTFTAWITRGRMEREYELDVTYSVTPRVPATYWQPDEGGEIEILDVRHNGAPFATTREEDDQLYDAACERADGDLADLAEDWAEYRVDTRRDALLMGRAA